MNNNSSSNNNVSSGNSKTVPMEGDVDVDDEGYSWEKEFKKSWENLREDENGVLRVDEFLQQQKSKKQRKQR